MTISITVKNAMAAALANLPVTSNGTEIQDIVFGGDDVFEVYPVIRIVPQGIQRTVDSTARSYVYQMDFVISVYLDMGTLNIPDAEIIQTLEELIDEIMERLDGDDWLPEIEGYDLSVVENSTTANIDTTQSKTGTALFCDLIYPVSYKKVV